MLSELSKTHKIYIGSDHAGYDLKMAVREFLVEQGFDVVDVGTYSKESCDYPDYARKVAENVVKDKESFGILICGTGIGMSIAANKVPGIRAALANDIIAAKLSRSHNNANILCMGGRLIGKELSFEIVKTFLITPYDGGRHERRLRKIENIEKEYCSK